MQFINLVYKSIANIFGYHASKMPRGKISLEDKERIVRAHAEGRDYGEMASALGVKMGTAWSIIRRAQRDGGVIVRQRGGARATKLDEEMAVCSFYS